MFFFPFLAAGGSELQDAAFGYFFTACVVIFLSILSYILLPKLVSHTFIIRKQCGWQNIDPNIGLKKQRVTSKMQR